MNIKPLFALLALAMAASACSDGGMGANGLVRFSQIVDFKETDDFSAPFMVNKTMMIALQDPESDRPLTAETTFPELDLTVDAQNLGNGGETFPLGFAQYGVVLDGEGDYRLVANQDGEELDHMKIKAENVKSMRLSADVVLSADGQDCSNLTEDKLDDLVLHKNQTLWVYVVPLNEDDEPMLGFLNLTASGPSHIELDAPLVGHGSSANALSITPRGDLGEDIEITIKEVTEGFEFSFTIETADEDADVSCD
tara:strand:+ start:305 stop:1063 length:759 start_codon:yes stop_codon:yes gene_type:complete